jgi:hypothetical protein
MPRRHATPDTLRARNRVGGCTTMRGRHATPDTPRAPNRAYTTRIRRCAAPRLPLALAIVRGLGPPARRPRLPIITTAQPLVQPALSQTEDSALVCTNVLCV